MNSDYPHRDKCFEYLKNYNTPAHVIRHCQGVSDTAVRIGRALNEAGGTFMPDISEIVYERFSKEGGREGYRLDVKRTHAADISRPFDIALTEAAGLLHDMARVQERHWDVAADYFENEGFADISKIIRIHMQYEFTTDAFHLTEGDLVCLGDRLVLEDQYTGIDRRMDYIIAKAERNGNMKARAVIEKKKEETKILLRQIEERIGMSLDELMSYKDK